MKGHGEVAKHKRLARTGISIARSAGLGDRESVCEQCGVCSLAGECVRCVFVAA